MIQVSGCHDCDPYKNYGTYCGKDRAISIHYYVFHKTLPDNCPLKEGNEAKYNELLLAVGQKYPNESRHETALRYIRQAEMLSELVGSLSRRPKTGLGASFDFLDDEGEDIYTDSVPAGLSETGTVSDPTRREGELITFKNKDKSAK